MFWIKTKEIELNANEKWFNLLEIINIYNIFNKQW